MRRVVLLALCLLPVRADAWASARQPDLEAIRAIKHVEAVAIDQPIRVDGVLDESAWQRATPATDFYQQQPAFGLILDTFQDRRSAFGIITNPGGAQRESLGYENRRRNDANWHGVWFVKTKIRADGWSLEYAIPFKTLRFPENTSQVWGMNMVRWARRANETSTWAPVPRQFSHYNVAYAGTLTGIANAQPGRNLQVKPFAAAQVRRNARGPSDGAGDGGRLLFRT